MSPSAPAGGCGECGRLRESGDVQGMSPRMSLGMSLGVPLLSCCHPSLAALFLSQWTEQLSKSIKRAVLGKRQKFGYD